MNFAETSIADSSTLIDALRSELAAVILGKERMIEDFLIAIFASGSVLLEDVPGVGKTTLAKAFANAVDLRFQRLQCTPDLLPADVFGFSVYNAREGTFEFRPGPVFANILLVDEINRASPRTQSALLEAMAERQVTTEGVRRDLQEPFFVIATQNPIGFHGTFPLPEAQLDRFFFHLTMDYPETEDEIDILYAQNNTRPEGDEPIITRTQLLHMQQKVVEIGVHRDVARYIVEIARRTRDDRRLRLGCSPRGSQMLFRAAQSTAFVAGRDHAIPDDVQRCAPLALSHRVVTMKGDQSHHGQKHSIIQDILSEVPVPS